MAEEFLTLPPVGQSAIAGTLTWAVTGAGAALVFFVNQVNQRFLDAMLGFAAGVMVAASFWSLLNPAIEIASHGPLPLWVPPTAGFLAGGGVLWGIDKLLPHLHPGAAPGTPEGIPTTWHRSALLVLAITLHNIPEGLAVGVGFGGTVSGLPSTGIDAALTLAIGIGIQNFPEGIAVAMPLRGDGMPRWKCFLFGQASGAVEPVAAVCGAAAVVAAAPLLPYALAFAAGAMVFVVIEELIPSAHSSGNIDLATVAFMFGFAVMMILDISL